MSQAVETRLLQNRVLRLERENEELRLRLDTCNRIMAENVKDAAALISTMARS